VFYKVGTYLCLIYAQLGDGWYISYIKCHAFSGCSAARKKCLWGWRKGGVFVAGLQMPQCISRELDTQL